MAPNVKRHRYLHNVKALIILINYILLFISLQFILIPLESKCELDFSWCKKLFNFAFILVKNAVFQPFSKVILRVVVMNIYKCFNFGTKKHTPVFSKALKVVFNLF